MGISNRFIILIALILLAMSCRTQPSSWEDDFEENGLDKSRWSTTWWVGRQSGPEDSKLRVEVREGDRRLYGKSGQATERCELLERKRHPLNRELTYGFRLFIPEDFPLVDTRLVMGQWKQSSWKLHLKHSPAIAQRYRNGIFTITVNNDSGREVLYSTGSPKEPALLGNWTEFLYRMTLSRREEGSLEVWIDGEKVIDYRGRLGYGNDGSSTYFRMGLYRDSMAEPMTVYYDDFSFSEE